MLGKRSQAYNSSKLQDAIQLITLINNFSKGLLIMKFIKIPTVVFHFEEKMEGKGFTVKVLINRPTTKIAYGLKQIALNIFGS